MLGGSRLSASRELSLVDPVAHQPVGQEADTRPVFGLGVAGSARAASFEDDMHQQSASRVFKPFACHTQEAVPIESAGKSAQVLDHNFSPSEIADASRMILAARGRLPAKTHRSMQARAAGWARRPFRSPVAWRFPQIRQVSGQVDASENLVAVGPVAGVIRRRQL